MAILEISLTKEAFEKLDDTQKGFYVAYGDGYELEGIGGKIRGLEDDKKRFEGFKGLNPDEAKKAVETLKAIGIDVDADTLKTALDYKKKADEKKLIDKGEYDKALQIKQSEYDANLSKVQNELDSFKTGFLQESLRLKLIEKGILPDRVNYAQLALANQVEAVIENGKLSLKHRDADLDTVIEGMKQSSPFLFAASNANGSGALGSNGNGGGSGRKWADLSRSEKTAAIRDADGDAEAAQAKFQ